MGRINLGSKIVNYPMPVAIVGSKVNNKVNFMTAAWISMVSHNPPKMAVTLGKHHHTNKGIKENKAFSVCFPSTGQMKIVDLCGLVSGEKVDKSEYFAVFYGESEHAPLVDDFLLNVECKLDKIDVNGMNETFIGDIVGIFADETVLTNGKVDFDKLDPIILGQVTTEYRCLGAQIGQAWSAGKK
ncbi:MAG TPA: flavin reductase family protein [Patescibacteria group bacterium]|nr:flavin reductase family protein [Patescibacteria group bacterium]